MEINLPPDELDWRRMEGRVGLAPYRTEGLIDTAAEGTCIKTSVADVLRLEPVRHASLHTASGKTQSAVYSITLQLGWRQHRPPDPIPVTAHAAEIMGVEVLIGMDVLRQGELIIYGPDGRFELILPRRVTRPT